MEKMNMKVMDKMNMKVMKRNLKQWCKQFHQYQQNEKSPLNSNDWI